MPISAIDAISPAFQHTKQQLTQPFRLWQWARLAVVGLLAGEMSSGGSCNAPSNFQMPQIPQNTGGQDHFLATVPWGAHPGLTAGLIAFLFVFGIVFWFGFVYVSSVMRFVLFDSLVEKQCRIRQFWGRRHAIGLRYFGWQLMLMLAMIVGITILIGVPAAFAFLLGWLKEPRQHLVPLILGGIALFLVFMLFGLTLLVVQVMTKDFVVPQMALENIGATEGWRRLLPRINREKGGYAGYIGMKIVMAIGAGILFTIVNFFVLLVLLIPIGGVGAIAVLVGKAAGLGWTAYTITLMVVFGAIALAILMYVIALVSVPVTVFFPAYSIYFFAARYQPLAALLFPPPPPVPSPLPTQVVPPPLPPNPEPIG